MSIDNNAKSTDAESVFNVGKINDQLHELNKIYNEGVDACIEELREEFLKTFGYADDEHGLFDDLKQRFEQLKKPIQ